MTADDIIDRVFITAQDQPDVIRAISDALASKNETDIREAFGQAGVSEEHIKIVIKDVVG
jgi:hypothetical protein